MRHYSDHWKTVLPVWNFAGQLNLYSSSTPAAYCQVPYEPHLERFEAVGPDGRRRAVEFLRAGFLAAGDQPELYFFRVSGETAEVVVGISGSSLKRLQQMRTYLSREAKIDLAALLLKRRMEAGAALESQNLLLRDDELALLAGELGIPV